MPKLKIVVKSQTAIHDHFDQLWRRISECFGKDAEPFGRVDAHGLDPQPPEEVAPDVEREDVAGAEAPLAVLRRVAAASEFEVAAEAAPFSPWVPAQ